MLYQARACSGIFPMHTGPIIRVLTVIRGSPVRGRSSPNGIYHSFEVARQPITVQKIKMIGIEFRHKRRLVVVFTEDPAIDILELQLIEALIAHLGVGQNTTQRSKCGARRAVP